MLYLEELTFIFHIIFFLSQRSDWIPAAAGHGPIAPLPLAPPLGRREQQHHGRGRRGGEGQGHDVRHGQAAPAGAGAAPAHRPAPLRHVPGGGHRRGGRGGGGGRPAASGAAASTSDAGADAARHDVHFVAVYDLQPATASDLAAGLQPGPNRRRESPVPAAGAAQPVADGGGRRAAEPPGGGGSGGGGRHVLGAFSESMSAAPAAVSAAGIEAVRAAPRADATAAAGAAAAAVSALFPLPDAEEGDVFVVALAALVVAPSPSGPEQRRGDDGVVSQVEHLVISESRFATVKVPLEEEKCWRHETSPRRMITQ